MTISDWLIHFYDLSAAAFLVFARISAMFVSGPIIGGSYVPPRVKALLSLAITVIVAPQLDLPLGIVGWWYGIMLIKEVIVGLALGFFLDIFFQAIRFGGDLIGRNAGFAAAEVFNPDSGAMTGPTGEMFYVVTALIFLLTNGHHELLIALQRSFDVVPLGAFVIGDEIGHAVTAGAEQVFDIGVAISFPVLITIMAISVADGVIARAVPQINLLAITFISKIMVTMILLMVSLPAVVTFIGLILQLAQRFVLQLLQAMAVS